MFGTTLVMPGASDDLFAPSVVVAGRECEVCAHYVPARRHAGGRVLGQVTAPTISLPGFSISISRATKPDFTRAVKDFFSAQDWGFALNWLRDFFRDRFSPLIGGTMDSLWSGIRTTQVNLIGTAISNAMGGLLSGATRGLQSTFNSLADVVNKEITSKVGGAVTSLQGQIGAATSDLGNRIAGLAGQIPGMIETQIGPALSGLQGQITNLAGQIPAEVQKQLQAAATVLTEQIPGMVQSQVTAALDLFTKQLPALIQEQAGAAIQAATGAMQTAFSALQEQFGNLASQITGLAEQAAAVPGMIQSALQEAAGFVVQQVDSLRVQLMGAINAAITALDQNVITPLRNTLEGFMATVQDALGQIGALAQQAINAANSALQQAGAALAQVGEAVVGFGGAVAGALTWLQANWPIVLAGVGGVAGLVILGPPIAKIVTVTRAVRR